METHKKKNIKQEVDEENEKIDSRVTELEEQLEKEKESTLRALADYQNLKNRVQKEREELINYSQNGLLVKILDVLDDFKHVIDSNEHKDDPWFQGVMMVYQKLADIVKMEGVEVIEVQIQDQFNPTLHEAIGFVTVQEDGDDQKIAQVVSNGYKKAGDDKVIRTAKVIVNKKS